MAIELKIGEFEAEYVGKMQLYSTTLDEQVKLPEENSSIGIIICKSEDKAYVGYVLKQTNEPIGVATYIAGRYEGDVARAGEDCEEIEDIEEEEDKQWEML